jgi:hypothetical protein
MSQEGLVDIIGTHPEIPTEFIADVGTAVPIANQLELLGTVVTAAGIPFESTASGNTVTYEIQYASAVAASDSTSVGVSAFDSSFFSVDSVGFVTLSGSSTTELAIDVSTPPGTNPVVPLAGVITVTGAQVAAGTTANVIRTDSLAANTMTIEVQRSSAQASTTIGANGVSHFDSSMFSVDANGFVSLAGGGQAIDSIGVQTGTNPIVPTSGGLVTINGAVVASGTNPVRSDGTGANTMAIEVQISQAIASSDVTKIGLSNFDSTKFTVDANGFVSASGTGIGQTITGNSGGALSPTAGNWNIFGASTAAGTSPVTTSGAISTLTVNVQKSQAIAATDATKIGLSAFDSSSFSVDANGFVTLLGGTEAIDSIGVDATSGGGTNPVLPTVAGLVTNNGAVVASGTNPVRTVSTAPNIYQTQVQISQAIAATDATKIGLSVFDSAAFDVDANGFVQLNGGGIASTQFDVQANTAPGTDPVVPSSSGTITVNGSAVAAHSVPIETRSRAANAYNVEVQYSSAVAATDATQSGISHFDSSTFGVDSNGFVTISAPTMTWIEVTGTSQNAAINKGYVTNNAGLVTVNLPSTFAFGDRIRVAGNGAGGWKVVANTGDVINFGSTATISGGNLASTNRYDAVELLAITANATWVTLSAVGGITVT